MFSGNVPAMTVTGAELLEKLTQLEEQARLASQEYPHGLVLERLRYIAALTRLLRASVQRDVELERVKPRVIAVPRQDCA
jgi:hypothetical protein